MCTCYRNLSVDSRLFQFSKLLQQLLALQLRASITCVMDNVYGETPWQILVNLTMFLKVEEKGMAHRDLPDKKLSPRQSQSTLAETARDYYFVFTQELMQSGLSLRLFKGASLHHHYKCYMTRWPAL